jgi:Mn-containing catalase
MTFDSIFEIFVRLVGLAYRWLEQYVAFSNDKSGLAEIFNGESPFGDGELEALDGLPEGFDIPQMPEAPQEYSPGLDKELKQRARA